MPFVCIYQIWDVTWYSNIYYAMENRNYFFPEADARFQADLAVEQIEYLTEKVYPQLAGSEKFRLILECLIELTEEMKLIRCQ